MAKIVLLSCTKSKVYRKATPEQKDILEDFLLYVREGEI